MDPDEERALADRRLFAVTAEAMDELGARLAAPAERRPRLAALLAEAAPWDPDENNEE